MTTITEVATQVIGVVTTGKEIYEAVVSAMDALESVQAGLSGDTKKQVVLSILQGAVENAGQVWSTWSALIANFIDHIKGLYNAIVGIVGIVDSFKSTASV